MDSCPSQPVPAQPSLSVSSPDAALVGCSPGVSPRRSATEPPFAVAPFIVRAPAACGALAERVESSLSDRLVRCPELKREEISAVTELDKSLFPRGFVISEAARETMRLLCRFSQTQLRPASKITSHRRFVGRVIVLLKRLSWPLVHVHLKETFSSLQEFNCQLVEAHAKLLVECERRGAHPDEVR